MKPNDSYVTRRTILVAGAALTCMRARAASLATAATEPLDRLRNYMLMRGALNDQLVIGFLSGRYYGVVDAEIKPLYGFVSATFARYRALAAGGYEGVSYEVPFFTDLATGSALEQWRNPYTNADVDVPRMASPPVRLLIKPELEVVVPNSPPGLTMQNQVVSTIISDTDVWMTEVTTSSFASGPEQAPLKYNEIVTLNSSVADLTRANLQRVPCRTSYTSVVSWRPWLKMSRPGGHLMGNGAGRYGATFENLPQNWHAAAAARRPEVLKDPGLPLKALLQ